MKRTVVFVCAIFALGLSAWAGGKSYDIVVHRTIVAGGVELQPGNYTVNVDHDRAVFQRGKVSAANVVRVETASEPYARTSMKLVNQDGKMHLRELAIRGTKTKLLFSETQP